MFDILSNYQNFELLPNGKSSEFVKTLCCQHDWRALLTEDGSYVYVTDEDDQELLHAKCDACGAECLRDGLGGEILEYDNSQNIQLGGF